MANIICKECGRALHPAVFPNHKRKHEHDVEEAGGAVMRTVRDEDCPSCEYPETVAIRAAINGRPIRYECANRACYWSSRAAAVTK